MSENLLSLVNKTGKFATKSQIISSSSELKPFVFILRFMAVVASVMSIRILSNVKLTDPTYKLLKFMSQSDLVYTCLFLFYGFYHVMCGDGALCSPLVQYTYFACYILISEYITNCLRMFNVTVEVFISIQRLFLLHKVKLLERIKIKYQTFFMLVVSFVWFIPVLLVYKIDAKIITDSNQTSFKLTKTAYGKTNSSKTTIIIMNLSVICLATIVIFFLNATALVKIKYYLSKKFMMRQIKCKMQFKIDWFLSFFNFFSLF